MHLPYLEIFCLTELQNLEEVIGDDEDADKRDGDEEAAQVI